MSLRGGLRGGAVLLVLLAALAPALAACSDDQVPAPGRADIDVDSAQLRQLRQEAGIAPCRPLGDGGHVDGGMPEVTLPCLGGGPDVDLADLRGPAVVNLWASWCKPCRQELPIYEKFHQDHGDDVAVLGVDFQDPQPMAALELARDSGVTYPLLADPQSDLSAQDPLPYLRGLPYLALVDADGEVVHQEFGEITSEDQLESLVEEHLGVKL